MWVSCYLRFWEMLSCNISGGGDGFLLLACRVRRTSWYSDIILISYNIESLLFFKNSGKLFNSLSLKACHHMTLLLQVLYLTMQLLNIQSFRSHRQWVLIQYRPALLIIELRHALV